jgi:hypothetical protein
MTTVASKDKDAEATELSQDQLDLVAGGIYFEVPKLQAGTPARSALRSPGDTVFWVSLLKFAISRPGHPGRLIQRNSDA